MMRFAAILATTALLLSSPLPASATASRAEDSTSLPRPAELERDIEFWKRVYSEIDTQSGFIHDAHNLGVVYEIAHFNSGASRRARERQVEKTKKRYKTILQRFAAGKRKGQSADEDRVRALWPADTTAQQFRRASHRLRFQLGQADKFRAGIVRSGAWKPFIEKTLAEHGLPLELAALPHVESSYTAYAHSRVGAAGLWQFTRSTGRRFMRVDHVVDERLDPFRATVAAARLLKQNRDVTGSWPLAITAYNHGASGMRRAVRKLGTRDIATIVRNYKSRTFGFASRNFYVEFLAAAEVSSDPERYFGPLKVDRPIDYDVFELPFHTTATALTNALGIDRRLLETSNPSLRPAVWRGAKRLPHKFALRVPRSELEQPAAIAITKIPKSARYSTQIRDLDYRVRTGDTLSGIASRFHVSMSELVAFNGLRSRHRIRVGQLLKLPDKGSRRRHPSSKTEIVRTEMPEDGIHMVRRGDTISRIAKRYDIDEKQILLANHLRNRNRIYAGQRLRLHGEVAAPAPPARQEHPHPDTSVTLSAPPARPPDETVVMAEDPMLTTPQEQDTKSLLADPSEYEVSTNDTIEVQGAETLGHYAEWLGVKTSRLRRLNSIPYGRTIGIGERIKVDLSQVGREKFEALRRRYHQELQDSFFARFEIEGTRTHITRRGDSVWELTEKTYRVPLWLLRQYNPDLDFASLHAGMRITVPVVKERENWKFETNAETDRHAQTG